MSNAAADIAFRAATPADFAYCARLYFAAMEPTIRALELDMEKHAASFGERWSVAEVRIITCDGADIGWLQTGAEADALFLKQLFVDTPLQRRGIGTQVMRRLMDEATREGRALTLGVVKTNPARRLYERLGFAITHEDERKFYMRRPCDAAGPIRTREILRARSASAGCSASGCRQAAWRSRGRCRRNTRR